MQLHKLFKSCSARVERWSVAFCNLHFNYGLCVPGRSACGGGATTCIEIPMPPVSGGIGCPWCKHTMLTGVLSTHSLCNVCKGGPAQMWTE